MIHDGHAPELVDGHGLDGLEPFDGYHGHVPAHGGAPREAVDELGGIAYGTAVPIRTEGQDLSGGHQGVDITFTLSQPGPNANLNGTAVQQALGRDYQRLEARIYAIDGPVIVCTSKEQAEQAYAQGPSSLPASEVTPGNPAAGATYTYTNPGPTSQTLQSLHVHFLADATVANRFVSVTFADASANTLATVPASGAIVASTAADITLAPGITTAPNGTSGNIAGGLPSVPIPPGGTIKINVSGIDVGDQLSNIVLVFAAVTAPIYFGPFSWQPAAAGPLVRRNCDELWLALPGAGAGTAHVTVSVSRRLGVEPPTLTRA